MSVQSVLDFWCKKITPYQWWRGRVSIDQTIRQCFVGLRGRVAEISVLDQFQATCTVTAPQPIPQDELALAQDAIQDDAHRALSVPEQTFLYMPFMHPESLPMQMLWMRLHDKHGLESWLYWAIRHLDVIRRFGRFPHRNAALGRLFSAAELDFLQTPNFSF